MDIREFGKQYCRYKLEPNPSKPDHFKKIPCGIDGRAIDVTVQSNLLEYKDAAVDGIVGLGTVGTDLAFVDVDNIEGTELINYSIYLGKVFKSYTEVSLSHKGLHAIVKVTDYPDGFKCARNVSDKVQVFFHSKQYVLLTSRAMYAPRYEDVTFEVNTMSFKEFNFVFQMQGQDLLKEVVYTSKNPGIEPKDWTKRGKEFEESRIAELLDEFTTELKKSSKQDKITKLFNCNTRDKAESLNNYLQKEYKSFSELDMALLNELYYLLGNKDKALAVFLVSPLWVRPENRRGLDYVHKTLDKIRG
jgi:hypothetical protein